MLPHTQCEYRIDGSQYISDESRKAKPPMLRLFEYHVQQYTTRDLAYGADALDAIRSVLDRFTNNSHSIDHLCGLPFQPRPMEYWFGEQDESSWSFDLAYGLCWTHGTGLVPPKRRKDHGSHHGLGLDGPAVCPGSLLTLPSPLIHNQKLKRLGLTISNFRCVL